MSLRASIRIVGSAVACSVAIATVSPARPSQKPMSLHNRLLLNRHVVERRRTLQVMLALDASQFEQVSTTIGRLGGRVKRSERSIGYVRAEVPIERLTELVAEPGVDAYQISSLSRASWYRDGAPQSNAEMYRGFEVGHAFRPARDAPPPDLPLLSASVSPESGYSADDDVGVGDWLAKHPTFDGRGVTIAFLGSARPEFTHPTLKSAKALDGREVPKLAGVLNTVDPEEPDDTRVDLSTEIRAVSAWYRVGNRTYIVPRPGTYRFGLFTLQTGSGLVQQFGVLRDEVTGEMRVDTDSDGDFREEAPIVDVNTRFDVHTLRVSYPRQTDLAFVIAEGPEPHQVQLYTARGGHQAMTVSVAAGARSDDGLAYGVAPAARVLLVRNHPLGSRLHDTLEGYLETIKRTDVDILCDSAGILMVPDTASDFAGLFMSRLIATYRKPIFHAAGNSFLYLNNVSSLGEVFSVGGSMGVPTFSALYGGATLGGMIVHPMSISGPALDGALKPHFLAPMNRISADVLASHEVVPLPKNAPTRQLPPGYGISCCTSASSPYAAGVAALLLSAAKQEGLQYSVASLGRALRVGARFLQGWPAHQQGSGVLDVNTAWLELQRAVEIPRIRVSGSNVHALVPYAASGGKGVGLFEREGWEAGMRGRRVLQLRRESGLPGPVTYRLSWTGNDGTFDTARAVTLPLNEEVPLPLTISVPSPGVHSAILNLHDPATDSIVLRSEATIVAPERLDTPNRTARFTGSLPLMRDEAHYLTVPDGVTAMSIELEVIRGSIGVTVIPSHGLIREYYDHVFPQAGRAFGQGKYSVLLPRPAAGTWSITVTNDSAWREGKRSLVSMDEASYSVSVRILTAAMEPRLTAAGRVSIDITNRAAGLQEPVIELSTGTLRSHHANFLPTGLPNQIDIDVPVGAATLALQLRGSEPATRSLELHVYDCTSGQCFSYDFTAPAAKEHTLVVRKPKPGRWVAAVNPAPFPTMPGGFVLDEIITGAGQRHAAAQPAPRFPGTRWTETFAVPSDQPDQSGATRVLLCELVDAAAESEASARPWENREGVTNLAERSVAIGMAILRRN